jgi:hypothetical protein
MPKKVVLALSTALIVLTMAFSTTAFAHDPLGEADHGDHSRDHSEQRATDHGDHDHGDHSEQQPTSDKQQASHSEEAPPAPWLPVAFTLSGAVVLGGLVVILRRS